jgi:triosephosphate isomerase
MNKKLLIGNWKENPNTLDDAKRLINISENFKNEKYSITHAVPSIFAGYLKSEKKNIILQNISCFEGGSHTGEISAKQAKDLGIEMSIVGHSETRLSPKNPHGDEDKEVNLKIKNLQKENMWACLCVGEYSRTEPGLENYLKYIETQIKNCLQDISDFSKIIIAYEPVWAIGKDAIRPATNEEIVEVIEFIKKITTDPRGYVVPVLYGGSVDETNAKEILNIPCVDGLLIGRASSDPEKWESLLNLFI